MKTFHYFLLNPIYNLVAVGFEPTKHMHESLSLAPLTARENNLKYN